MSTTLVSNSDLIMPAIVYGTAWKEDRTADLVELALKKGFRGIDTACQPKHYNEPGVGEGIQRAMSFSSVHFQTHASICSCNCLATQ